MTQHTGDLDSPLLRAARAPFFAIALLFSMLPVFFIFAWVSVGAWCEDVLHWLGYDTRPRWLPGVAGIAIYVGLGIAAPAYLGHLVVGWPGLIIGPVLVIAAISRLGHW